MQAITIVFVGTLLGLIALALLPIERWRWTSVSLAECLVFLAVGALAASRFGRHRWRRTLGDLPGPPDMAIGLAAGLIGAAVSYSYVRLLAGDSAELDPSEESVLQGLVAFALLPAIFEEWLCRGVLWEASRRIVPTLGTILITAGLFALLHVPLAGGWALAPHRFVLGSLLGWSRARSDSLLPAMGGHALHNALFVVAV
ncbi:MAG: CPBP family intramembrane glutamic endopeptidase [Planctomycetota bacterium]